TQVAEYGDPANPRTVAKVISRSQARGNADRTDQNIIEERMCVDATIDNSDEWGMAAIPFNGGTLSKVRS
ncbi:hypothetical protein ACCT09_53505, partial [Rhizobium ruizarguesonis]